MSPALLFELRPFATLLLSRRVSPRIRVYRRMFCNIARNAVISGTGTLHLGPRWDRRRFFDCEFVMYPECTLDVNGVFSFYTGARVAIYPKAKLSLGSGYVNHAVTIDCYHAISIGEGVAIAKGVTIRDSDAHRVSGKEPYAPVQIGNKVWIGANVTILKGTTIEDGSVIAAGAVVTRSVPAASLVAGVPAKVIKENVSWT